MLIFTPGTYARVVNREGAFVERASLSALQNRQESTSTIYIEWNLHYCRRTLNRSGSEETVTINTIERQILANDEEEEVEDEYNADDENDTNPLDDGNEEGNPDDCRLSDDELGAPVLSRAQRRLLHRLRKQKVKQDIFHIFQRLEKILGKEHGAFGSFRISLRNAVYILNQDDLDACMKVLRDKYKLSDKEIETKLRGDFGWFKRRVRRLVPSPKDLEERYLAVYNEYKDIVCTKSGKALFGSKKAKRAHKALLKHIRKNCVSDIPFVSYYTPYGEDKDGLTLYKCLRGTDALEGLHQKLRQLVRGFSNSPRLIMALLSDFFNRWNQNIEINVRGLDKEYDGLYVGRLLEEEIEELLKWNLEDPPHPDWISTMNFEDTGEVFGLVEHISNMNMNDDDSGSDADVNDNAEVAADELLEIEVDDDEDENELMQENFTAATQWLAAVYQKDRPYGKVKTQEEWTYFNNNVMKFQGSSAEADNYSSISFSAFADSWNGWVSKLGRRKPTVTYKLACHLKDAFKASKKRAVEKTTLQPHRQNLRALDDSLRNEDDTREFAGPNDASRVIPAPPITTNTTTTTAAAASTQTFETRICYPPVIATNSTLQPTTTINNTSNNPTSTSTDTAKKPHRPKRQRRQRKSKRCRKCGLEIITNRDKHTVPPAPINEGQRHSVAYLPNMAGYRVEDHCTVSPDMYSEGYPLQDGELHPRRKKRRD